MQIKISSHIASKCQNAFFIPPFSFVIHVTAYVTDYGQLLSKNRKIKKP